MVDSSGIDFHQRVGVLCATNPDRAILAVVVFPLTGDGLGTLQRWRVVCPVLIEGCPGSGLDGVDHALVLIDLIIEAKPRPIAT